jgi:four helix bundle protein
MTASSLAPDTIAPSERVGVLVVSATLEEAVTFSPGFDRRLARLFAVESSNRARDARGVIAAVREPSGWIRLCFNIDVAGSEGPDSSLLALGGMHNPQSSSILEHSLAVVALARPLVETVQRKDRDLASQLRRALSSICLNLAEGFGNSGGHSRLRFETALGSLKEAQTALQVGIAWGHVSRPCTEEALRSLNSLGGRIYGLVRR